MALRDTSWAASSGSPQTANAILTDYKTIVQRAYFFPSGTYTRTRTIVTREWLAMTQAAATNAVDTLNAGDSTGYVQYEAQQTNMITNAYKVIQNTDSYGNWTEV